ncbi:TonB-dependent receptor domain-containing protein [Sediminicola luteus]|uniref:Outer membrane protein beta-barrel domain-containing protein n=1 Tax=Sediminicola luteus TaxID=319238 RepID=A0A2A4GD13_9FLAO|nr:outer membrane beta-barrel family protein [Sediminicola luteus]PCE66343.1 hypothetical protein B7P33_03325 [Sediminicola luteus]
MKRFVTLLFISLPLLSVGQFHLKGQVVDSSQQAIAFANVVLVQENQVLAGKITDTDGYFEFESSKKGSYTLKVSFVGFAEYSHNFTWDKDIDLEKLILKSSAQNLDEVVVAAKKPTVVKQVDRLVFNVENSTISNGNAWEILKKTPGLISQNDNLSVRNTSDLILLINDKRVYLSQSELKDLMEGTAGTDITAIEVVDNPPAKYDAEGGALINIKMKKSVLAGYKGNVSTHFEQSIYAKWQGATSHFYKTKKLDLYLGYSYSDGRNNRQEDEDIRFTDQGLQTRFLTDLDRNSWYQSHNLRLTGAYELSEKSEVVLSTNGFLSPNNKSLNQARTLVLDPMGTPDSRFTTEGLSFRESHNLGLDLDYIQQLDDQGQKVTLSGHYTDYDRKGNQYVFTEFMEIDGALLSDELFTTQSQQDTQIRSVQADYENPSEDGTSWEAGLKWAEVGSDSDLQHFNYPNGLPIPDPSKTNRFRYYEANLAAYTSAHRDWQKWSVKAGLRTEFTRLTGISTTLDQKNTDNYLKWFPTIYLQYRPHEDHDLSLSYGKRIQRPSYNSLNPFTFYFGQYSYFEGNPNLRPSIKHNLDLEYSLKQNFNFGLFYQYATDAMLEVSFQDNDGQTIRYTTINTDREITYGALFFSNMDLNPDWNLYVSLEGYYELSRFQALENENQLLTNDNWLYYVYASTTYQLLNDKSLIAELSFWTVSDAIQGSMNISGTQDLSVGLTKKLWDEKLTLGLRINDILDTQVSTISTQYLDQNSSFLDNRETQSVELSLRYAFGNQKLKKKNGKERSAEQKRL